MVDLSVEVIVEVWCVQVLRVSYLEEKQLFLVTPWFTLKSGWF